MRLISVPILLLAFPALSFVLGIIPGFLLGIFGWHEDGAWVLGIIYALGYRMQRQVKYGGITLLTYPTAVVGGVGLGVSVRIFGALTN